MSRLLASLLALGIGLFAPGLASAQAPRPVPALKKEPAVDARLEDLKTGLALKPLRGDAWSARLAVRKDTLFLGLEAKDGAAANDVGELSLHFPLAGTTAEGRVLPFGANGFRDPEIQSKAVSGEKGFTLEAAIPARALPRFPARDPLVFDVCVTWKGATNCVQGSMSGGQARLPEEFRKSLKLKVPPSVVGLESRPDGWVGYAQLHYPVWVSSDVPLTAQQLRRLVTDRGVDPRSAGINLPDELVLPDGQKLLTVLSGKDPYEVKGECDVDRELRLGLYLVKGQAAERVLEWPASTCPLGRAAAIELDEHGELTLGYTNGATVTFRWSKDHFERTEIGSR